MDYKQIFDKSEALYLNIIKDISHMAETVADSMKKAGKPFDPELTVMKFDIVFQYSLLQVACSDNELAKNETAFIRDLTEYADFCDFLSADNGEYKDVTWEKLMSFNANEAEDLLDIVEDRVRSVSEEVINVFAICDKATKHDYLSDLSDNVFGVISGLALADGDEDSEDLKKNILIFECLDKIESRLK